MAIELTTVTMRMLYKPLHNSGVWWDGQSLDVTVVVHCCHWNL